MEGKSLKLLIADPSKVFLSGGEQALACGAQKPRAVSIEYWAKPNARLGTAGDVATIDFQ